MKLSKLIPFFLLALAFLSCKEIVTQAPTATTPQSGQIRLSFSKAPTNIQLVVATLSRQNYQTQAESLAVTVSDSGSSGSGSFGNVEAGTWHLKVDAFNDSDVIQYTGETDVQVFAGQITLANLTLQYVGSQSGGLEIHVTWGGTPPPFDLTEGLELYLPFNGSLHDSTGNGNNGTAANPSYTSDALGTPGGAYKFNAGDYITIPNSSSLNPTNQLTISFWLRVDTITDNYMPIFMKSGPPVGYYQSREYGLLAKENNADGLVQYWYPQLKSAGDNSDQHELMNTIGSSFLKGHWDFFVFVIDRVNHKMQIYSNGLKTGEMTDSYSSFNVNSYPLMLGFSDENIVENSPLNGSMDNFRLYNRALGQQEINALFAGYK